MCRRKASPFSNFGQVYLSGDVFNCIKRYFVKNGPERATVGHLSFVVVHAYLRAYYT